MNYHRDKTYIENESLFRNIFKTRFYLTQKFVSNPKTVLDIGCSNGVFLDLYKESETWGVEPSLNAKIAAAKDHKILKTTFEKAELPKNYFDLVIMNHTLEHMDNPLGVLKKAFSLLKKEGVLFIDVPNAGGLGAKILGKYWPYRLPDEHKHQFTKESLSRLFRKSGFKILTFKSRSGIFEYANPFLELKRPRFLFDVLTSPYALIATLLNAGDSMSLIGKKI